MELVKQGKSKFIIIPENNNQAAEFASQELKKYLLESTGANLPIENKNNKNGYFYVGGNRYEGGDAINVKKMNLNGDGFVLRITETDIYLDAQNGRGLIFGVYRFLEKYLGVRFFNSDCELVPKTQTLIIKEDLVIEKPEFSLRSYLNGTLWELGGADLNLYLKYKQNNEHLAITDKKYGGRCSMYGRNGTHNMGTYVPYEKYKDSHPEFFYYYEPLGYRTIDLLSGITEDGELDESMEVSVAKIVIEELKKDIIENPDITYFQFEQEDGDTIYPYQEGTEKYKILQKYGRSGILIRFCNMLAREIRKWSEKELDGRIVNIVTFAYSYTKDPPIVEKDGKLVPIDHTVVADDNVVLRFSMNTGGVNVGYHHFHEKNVDFLNKFNGWKVVAKKFMIWCYDMDDVTHIWYYPVIKNIRQNVDNFIKLGVIYLMFEAGCSTIHGWQTDLRGYIYSNMMWDSKNSVNKLFNEYVDNFYGVANEEVKKIIYILENYSNYVREIYDGYYVSTGKWSYRHADTQSEKLLDRLLSIYDKGEEKVNKAYNGEQKKLFLKRLNTIKLTLLHMKVNKLNWEFYRSAEISEVTQFSGQSPIPPNEGQSLYNVEMVWRVKEKLVIPDDVKEKIKALDPLSISDYMDFDNAK